MRIGIDLQVLNDKRTGIGNYAFHLVRALVKIQNSPQPSREATAGTASPSLEKRGGEHEWVLFVPSSVILNAVKNLMRSFGVPQDDKKVRVVELPEKRIPFWDAHVRNAWIMKKEKLDVLHGVANVLPLFWNSPPSPALRAPSPERGEGKSVVTIHDLAIYKHPEWFARGQWLATKVVVPRSIKKANKIIVPSEATKRDLMELFNVADSKIAVIPHGVEERFFSSTSPGFQPPSPGLGRGWGRGRKYILFVGTIEPRKNVARLIEAYEGLPDRIKNEYELVIAGGRGWGEEISKLKNICHSDPDFGREKNLMNRDSSEYLRMTKNRISGDDKPGGAIKLLDYVPDKDLPALYQNASLFVYPSLYEGFGLPVLEAMAAGAPVVTSRGTSMEEIVTYSPPHEGEPEGVAEHITITSPNPSFQPSREASAGTARGGEGIFLVDPYSVDEIREAIVRLIRDDAYSSRISKAGLAKARQFTWEKTAKETLRVYDSFFPHN